MMMMMMMMIKVMPFTTLCLAGVVNVCCLLLSAVTVTAVPPSLCRLSNDTVYGGILVDCQGQGLTSLPPIEWIPEQATSILLQSNSISRLLEASFAKAPELRYLSLATNKISSIDPLAFQHNKKIQVIDLESNCLRIDSHSMGGPLFHNMSSLVELRLANNDLDPFSSYSPDILMGLPNLRVLTIDTFEGDLEFNGIFRETKNLSKLTLTGSLSYIRNDSFEDFELIPLKELVIIDASNLVSTEVGAFRYLQHLDVYHLEGVNQGTKLTLESLAPFVNRNFTMLKLHNLYNDHVEVPYVFKRDCELNRKVGQYLSKMCVKHFEFTSNSLFFIETGMLTGPLWSKCLVSLDVSDNPLLGNVFELIRLSLIETLQSLRISGRKYSFIMNTKNDGSESFMKETFMLGENKLHADINKDVHDDSAALSSNANMISRNAGRNLTQLLSFAEDGFKPRNNAEHLENAKENNRIVPKLEKDLMIEKGGMIVRLPMNLEYLDVSKMSTHSIYLNFNITVQGSENLKTLQMSDSGISRFSGSLHGMENLTSADISKNDGSDMTRSFLSSFPQIATLIMSHMNLEKALQESPDLFQSLIMLKHLDISFNNLHVLPATVFSNNMKLEFLNLAGNRLNALPLLFQFTPHLQLLDLRQNSILHFSLNERKYLEMHSATLPAFKILLEGNVFSCSCSSISFLRWLQTTRLDMDNTRAGQGYSCLLMDGEVTTTRELNNLENFWRLCNGKDAFYNSIILMCLTALGICLFTLGIKFKTQIQATLFQYFEANFVLKTQKDYVSGVYLGYADQDADFACLGLRDIVENRLHFTTYIRHRDLLPASNIAQAIVSAIHSSWRVVLLFTDHYLADEWSYLAIKTAAYSVGPSNPGRIVLILSDDQIGNRVPVYLLNAVREDCIISMNGEPYLSNSNIQTLREALSG